jgi:hypothetical protein
VATELPLYYVLTFPFLQSAGGVVGITSEKLADMDDDCPNR